MADLVEFAVLLLAICAAAIHAATMTNARKRNWIDDTLCPSVKPMRSFELSKIQGSWAFQQYFASSEEALSYHCMLADMEVDLSNEAGVRVTMSFRYSYLDDPDDDVLTGNMTWIVPDEHHQPAHWEHAEKPYEGVYNTYVLDTNYDEWLLLLHCAEKKLTPRYLSSIIMSRSTKPLKPAVLAYLKDKLARYNVPLEYVFPVRQDNCNKTSPRRSQIFGRSLIGIIGNKKVLKP